MAEHGDVLNTHEAAELLKVRPETIVREARAGRLPGRRIGKQWRFSRDALLAWLAEGPGEEDLNRYRRPRVPPSEQADASAELPKHET